MPFFQHVNFKRPRRNVHKHIQKDTLNKANTWYPLLKNISLNQNGASSHCWVTVWETSRTHVPFPHCATSLFQWSPKTYILCTSNSFPQHYLVLLLGLCSAEEGGLGSEEGEIIVLLVQAAVAAAHAIATGHLRGLQRPLAPFQAPGSARRRDTTKWWRTASSKWLDSGEGTDGNLRAGESRYQSTSAYHCWGLRKRAQRRPQFLFQAGQ